MSSSGFFQSPALTFVRILLKCIFATIILSGCLATTDLLSPDSAISWTHRSVAEAMSNAAQRTCITYSYLGDPNNKISGNTKAANKPPIRRLFASNKSWYKALTTINGATDHIFYNSSTFELVCGDNSWAKRLDAGEIRFQDILNNQTPSSPPSAIVPPNSTNNDITQRLIRLKDLYERKLISEHQYNEQVKIILSGTP